MKSSGIYGTCVFFFLSHMNPFNPPTCFFYTHSNIFLPSNVWISQVVPFLQVSPPEPSPLPQTCHKSYHLAMLGLITLKCRPCSLLHHPSDPVSPNRVTLRYISPCNMTRSPSGGGGQRCTSTLFLPQLYLGWPVNATDRLFCP